MNVLEFENHLKASNRQEGYLEIIMYVPDSNIGIANVSSTDKLYICDIDAVKDIKNYTNVTIATLEENLWLLDGRFPNYQGRLTPGYISNSVSNEDGNFETNPVMNVELTRTSKVENFSVILNPSVPTGYPKSIKLKCYDSGGTLVGEYTQDLEGVKTLPSVNFLVNQNNVYRMDIEFIGTRFRHRRIRVSSIMFGKTIFLNQNQVLNVDYTDKTSFCSRYSSF